MPNDSTRMRPPDENDDHGHSECVSEQAKLISFCPGNYELRELIPILYIAASGCNCYRS